MSARISFVIAFGVLLAASSQAFAQSSRQAALPPAAPAASAKPADEAAAAAQETEEALRHGDGIAAKVNDTVISNYDVRQRIALYVSTSGSHPSAEALKQIRDQVLKQLETERLQLLEAEKSKVTVTAAEVDKAIADILKDNHLALEQLNKILTDGNVRMETLRAQIAAQIAWSKLVEDQLGDRVHVSTLDVDDELVRLKRDANKPHYVVSEIFQAVDTPEQDGKVKKDMENLETQLQAGAPFSAVARQFSQNPTAAQGGDLGIVQQGQLPPELDKILVTMRPGMTSPPIRAAGGYYILLLRALEMPEGMNVPDPTPQPTGPPGTLSLVRVLLPIEGAKPPKDLIQKAFEAAMVMRSQIQSCDGAKAIAAKLPAARTFEYKDFKLADMSTEMQAAINQAGPGGTTQPMGSTAGVELIVRCDKAVPRIGTIHMPSRDQVEQQIYQEQMTTLSRQYLRDLRRDADIEAGGKT